MLRIPNRMYLRFAVTNDREAQALRTRLSTVLTRMPSHSLPEERIEAEKEAAEMTHALDVYRESQAMIAGIIERQNRRES